MRIYLMPGIYNLITIFLSEELSFYFIIVLLIIPYGKVNYSEGLTNLFIKCMHGFNFAFTFILIALMFRLI